MSSLLQVRGLDVVYQTPEGALNAVHKVSFEVQPGEIVGIVGESGCGKSSVALGLLRLLPPNGQIRADQLVLRGQDLREIGEDELRDLRGRDLAMIFQDPMTSLNPVFTIGTQMLDIQRAHLGGARSSREDLRRRAIQMLDRVGIPDAAERIHHFPHQFSGGMRQRIMIAMALMSKPALMIADEPTASLDVTLGAQILELMNDLRQEYGTAILFISHDLGVTAQLVDRVIVMYAGRMVEKGDVVSIFEQPRHPYTQALLASVPSRGAYGKPLPTIPGRVPSLSALPPGCKFCDRCPYAQAICQQREPEWNTVDGHQVRCHIYAPEAKHKAQAHLKNTPDSLAETIVPASKLRQPCAEISQTSAEEEVLLTLCGVSTHFESRGSGLKRMLRRGPSVVRAVDDVSLEVRRGEVVGVVGESGCGKTTLAKTVLGLVQPADGQIVFDGEDITHVGRAGRRRLSARMQMVFQDVYTSLSPRLRVSYLLTEPCRIQGVPPEGRSNVGELLAMVGLSRELADKYPHELSGGQARRIGIARALSLHPELLIADEPTSGLDASVAANILNLMKTLADQLGLTYIVITHDLSIVGYLSDRVAVMYLGNLVEVGPTRRVFDKPAHPYTLALRSAIPEPDPRQRNEGRQLLVKGEIPSPKEPPPGCRFHTRCPFAQARCKAEMPVPEEIEPDHVVRCHFWRYIRERGAHPSD